LNLFQRNTTGLNDTFATHVFPSMHKTSAWPLALTYALLVAYASLYPFSDWRFQGISPWAFLTAALPRYWTFFDVATNLTGYGPLGFLLALGVLRSRRSDNDPGRGTTRGWRAIGRATALSLLLSLTLESLQNFLPVRVPSNVDLLLNTLGGGVGAVLAVLLEKWGAIDRWSRFRSRWFVAQARGALVLLALWPFALLFPAAVPFGLGQVAERLETALAELLEATPFLDWLPLREVELQPLMPATELVCVVLGVLIPCLLGYSVIRDARRRLAFLCVLLVSGGAATALSAALSYGPAHAWAWQAVPVQAGMVVATVLALMMLAVPVRVCAAVLLLALVVHASLLNQAPTSAYFAQTLQTWEQGRFIRFHGLAQWLGWLWPYATLVYVLQRVAGRDHPGQA
jgi:VanZ family protein